MAATEIYTNNATTTVTNGGTTATSGSQTWTVASSAAFPAAATGSTQFHVGDPAAPSELIAVTNVSSNTWTVTRGAESTTPVAHAQGFTVASVITAGGLNGLLSGASGPLVVGSGGTGGTAVTAYAVVTGGTSVSTALQTVSGLGSSGQVLTSQGAGALPQWSAIGTAASISGTVAILNGGTGQGSAAAAYNALSPMTTTGDIEVESAVGVASRLAGNTSSTKNFLTSTGSGGTATVPAWGTIASADVPALNQLQAPIGAVSMNGQKITNLANGAGTTDAMALGQLPQNPGPGANQLQAWTYDIAVNGTTTGSIAIGGTLYLSAVTLYYPCTLSKIWWINTVAGTTPTSGQSQVGLYNSAGSLVTSVTTTATAAVMAIAGIVSPSLSSPYVAPAGNYWVGMVFQAATEPTILRNSTNNGNYVNAGISSAANYRWAVNGTAITTALPSTINTLSNTTTGTLTFWAGIS